MPPPDESPINLTLLIAALQNAVTAVNNLNQTIANKFPSATGTSATASGGAATLPANPVGFITTTLPNTTTTVKVPYYN